MADVAGVNIQGVAIPFHLDPQGCQHLHHAVYIHQIGDVAQATGARTQHCTRQHH